MSDNIFDENEWQEIFTSKPKRSLDQEVGARRDDFNSAFQRIKNDRRTHVALCDTFGEAEGFVLQIPSYGLGPSAQKTRNTGEVHFSYEFQSPVKGRLLLAAQRSGNAALFLGDFQSVRVTDIGAQSIINIYTPDQNIKEILRQRQALSLAHPENFALGLLARHPPVLEIAVHDESQLSQDRIWKDRKYRQGISPPISYTSELNGHYLLEFYELIFGARICGANSLRTRLAPPLKLGKSNCAEKPL